MKTVRLGDIVNIYNGSTPSTSDSENFNGNIQWITPKDLSSLNSVFISNGERTISEKGFKAIGSKLLPKGTILLSSRAPIGLMAIANTALTTNQGFKNLVCDHTKIYNIYLYYLLKLQVNEIQNLGSGTTFKEVSKSVLENFTIQIHENLNTQQHIAKILSQLDQKIALNNQINAQLEQMAKTLYDYWFVQFDFPNADGQPYRSSGGEMVYDETLKREIPKGWGVGKLGDITECLDAKRKPLSSKERECRKGSIPYYGATGIFDYIDDFIFDGDYVLLAEDGSIMNEKGNPILQRITGKSWVNNHAHILLPQKNYNCYLLMMLLKDVSVVSIQTGSIQLKITQENMNNIPIFLIPETLKKSINNILNPIDDKILLNKKQNQQLTQLRDFLLPMLMNGQVGVSSELCL